jgi:hypothetical protein
MHARAGQSYFHRHIAPARVPSLDSAPMQFTDRIILLEHVSLHFVTTLLQYSVQVTTSVSIVSSLCVVYQRLTDDIIINLNGK